MFLLVCCVAKISDASFSLTPALKSEDNCYLLKENSITYKSDSKIHRLTLNDDLYIYESDEALVEIDKNNYSIKSSKILDEEIKELKLSKATEMIFLFKNLKNNSVLKQ